MIIETERKYEQLDYMIEPTQNGSYRIVFIANHRKFDEYSGCDADYLRTLGRNWVKYGIVHIPEID